MFKKNLVIMVLVLVGLSIAGVASAGMRSQRRGMEGMMRCSCCMSGMMGIGEMEGSGEMEGMAGMGKEEMAQRPLAEGRKKVGEEFTCPVDGMRMKVTENTPATEYRGKTYYFCNEVDRQVFLKDPERYVKGKSAE